MAGKWKPGFRNATPDRLHRIDHWLTMADDSYQEGKTVARLRAGARSGALSSCLGIPDARHYTSQWEQWINENRWDDVVLSRTEARFLVAGQAEIGASVCGPSERVLKQVLRSGGINPFLQCLWWVTKLHALSIAEEYRGRGYGGHMLENAVKRAGRSGFIAMYGVFDGRQRPHLAEFYESHGFTILDFDQPISLEEITGIGGAGIGPDEGERFFVRNLMP